jgi:hypothetical protein
MVITVLTEEAILALGFKKLDNDYFELVTELHEDLTFLLDPSLTNMTLYFEDEYDGSVEGDDILRHINAVFMARSFNHYWDILEPEK